MSQPETPAAEAAAVRDVLRLLARLARRPATPGADGAAGAGLDPAPADAAALARARRQGWVESDAAGGGLRLSRRGRELLRRAMSGQDLEVAAAATRGVRSRPQADMAGHNPDESPLAWLRRRKGRDGEPLIGDEEFRAGERLRADFWYAGMSPRVTSSWSGGVTGGGRRTAPGCGVELRDEVIAAQTRVRRALAAVGPELANLLIDVCCHLKGIEEAERQAGWPQRSGKVVLRVALAALARHYGLIAPDAGGTPGRTWHWGAAGYRPGLDEWT